MINEVAMKPLILAIALLALGGCAQKTTNMAFIDDPSCTPEDPICEIPDPHGPTGLVDCLVGEPD